MNSGGIWYLVFGEKRLRPIYHVDINDDDAFLV